MSDKENMTSKLKSPNSSTEVSFLKAPNNSKVLKVRNNDCQGTQTKEPLQNKITVEYERVGSFQVFETTCPLEFFSMNPSSTTKVDKLSEMTSRGKSGTCSKQSKEHKIGVLPSAKLDSEGSEDEQMTEAFNEKLRTAEPQKRRITLDAFFRSENPVASLAAGGDATVFWAKGQNDDEHSESDLDHEIGKYIRSQKDKKKKGESVTGESLWYDQERSIIRNLHENGSISLTSYGDTDERIFGKTEIFDSIMTTEERAMLRAREPEEEIVVIKPEKKKKPLETRKKVKKCSRPKDQGDWVQ